MEIWQQNTSQWWVNFNGEVVTLGRFDIRAQIATMSRFRCCSVDKDIWTDSKGSILIPLGLQIMLLGFRTDQPDYSFLPEQAFDWTYSVYGDVHDILT